VQHDIDHPVGNGSDIRLKLFSGSASHGVNSTIKNDAGFAPLIKGKLQPLCFKSRQPGSIHRVHVLPELVILARSELHVAKRVPAIIRHIPAVHLQYMFDHGEGELAPGNILQREELHIETLTARLKFLCCQAGSKYHVDLADMGDIHQCIRFKLLELYTRFLPGLALGALQQGLVVFKVTGWHCPLTVSRLYPPFAEEKLVPPLHDRTGNHLWILIENLATDITCVPWPIVAHDLTIGNLGAALRTVFHRVIFS
jgi:hypothetical protein